MKNTLTSAWEKQPWLLIIFFLIMSIIVLTHSKINNFYQITERVIVDDIVSVEKFKNSIQQKTNTNIILLDTSRAKEYLRDFKNNYNNVNISERYLKDDFIIVVKLQVQTIRKNHFFHIFPDEQLKHMYINGKQVDLSMIPSRSLSDWSRGFKINLKDYLQKGTNVFYFHINNQNPPGGVRLYPFRTQFFKVIIYALWLFSLVLFFIKPYKMRLIVLLFLFLACFYQNYTGIFIRSYDMYGHLNYIQEIFVHHRLPNAAIDAQAYHPPLYYFLSALWFTVNKFIYGYVNLYSLAIFALFINLLQVIFVEKLARRFFPDSYKSQLLFVGFVLFFPSFTLHSIRIGNDLLFSTLGIIAFYYFFCWWQDKKLRPFCLGSLTLLLGILTKSNTLGIAAMAGTLLFIYFIQFKLQLVSYFREGGGQLGWNNSLNYLKKIKFSKMLIKIGVLSLCIFIGIGFSIGRNLYEANKQKVEKRVLMHKRAIDTLNKKLQVENGIKNILIFDIKSFFTIPSASTWRDDGGRQFFFVFLLKSMLWGEFEHFKVSKKWLWNLIFTLMTLGNILFLLIIIATLYQFFYQFQPNFSKILPQTLLVLFSVLALLYYKVTYSYSCHQDFRYVYPILFVFAYFWIKKITHKDNTPKSSVLFYSLYWGLVGITLSFYILLYLASLY